MKSNEAINAYIEKLERHIKQLQGRLANHRKARRKAKKVAAAKVVDARPLPMPSNLATVGGCLPKAKKHWSSDDKN
jgi:hypothetical protein